MLFFLFGSASVHLQPAPALRRPVVPCQPAFAADTGRGPAGTAGMLFDSVVDLCIAHQRGMDVDFQRVPWLLDEVLRQDEAALRQTFNHAADGPGSLRTVTNLTCLQPLDDGGDVQQTFNEELLALPTREGRCSSTLTLTLTITITITMALTLTLTPSLTLTAARACVRGACSCACSRVTLPLASEALCARLVDHAVALQPPLAEGTLNLYL